MRGKSSDGGGSQVPDPRSRRLRPWPALVLAILCCAGCDVLFRDVSPEVVADAGPDRAVAIGETLQLDGSRSLTPPLRIWLTDGEGENRNKLVVYDSQRGVQTVGPLRSFQNAIYGYPSDLVVVGNRVIGLDTYHRQVYELYPEGGRVQGIGSTSRYKGLSALAWDAQEEQLYALDAGTNQLLRVDLASGEFHPTSIDLPGRRPLGLAFDPERRKLVVSDGELGFLYSVDPATGRWGSIVKPQLEGDGYYDELAYHGGRLYGLHYHSENDTGITQLREIDLETGAAYDVGPPLPNVSPRSLLILEVPPRAQWQVVEGPGDAEFDDPNALATGVRFEREGRYELELVFDARPEPVRDSVVVQVTAASPS